MHLETVNRPDQMDAAGVVIRALTVVDRAALAFAFSHLSERSRYRRFFAATPKLIPAAVKRLTAADHWHDEVLIAWSPVPRTPVGVAEYMRAGKFDHAEVALAVIDSWQGRGVGRALVEALKVKAYAAGIRHFDATVLSENRAALALLRGLGGRVSTRTERGLIEAQAEVRPKGSRPTGSWTQGQVVRHWQEFSRDSTPRMRQRTNSGAS